MTFVLEVNEVYFEKDNNHRLFCLHALLGMNDTVMANKRSLNSMYIKLKNVQIMRFTAMIYIK